MSDIARLVLEIDSKGVVTANGNLDLFKKKSDEAAKASSLIEGANKKSAQSFDLLSEVTNIQAIAYGAANMAVVKFMNSCAETAGTIELLKTNLQVVTGSAEKADVIFRQLQTFAAETPFSINGITDTATQLLNVNVAAGDLMDTIKMLGDVSGGSQDKLNRIMMNYTQVLSVGKASTMDIRQFAQANLPIYAELEKVTGKTGAALQDMITDGKITGDVVTAAFKRMTEEGGKFYNGMALAAETFKGKQSTMEDSVNNLAAKFADLWIIDFGKNAFDSITRVSDKLSSWMGGITFGKTAFDTFNKNPNDATFAQKEYVANQQISYWMNRSQMLKRVGDGYQQDPEYQEAIKQLNSWYDYLDKITHQEAVLTKEQRESEEAAKKAAEANKNAVMELADWQKILKQTLDLKDVTTGKKAVEDYVLGVNDSLNGAIAYAQMTGGKVSDVYIEYADKVDKAIQVLLSSGQFSLNDDAIKGLFAEKKDLSTWGNMSFSTTNGIFGNPFAGKTETKPDTSDYEQSLQELYVKLGDLTVEYYAGEEAAQRFNLQLEHPDWSTTQIDQYISKLKEIGEVQSRISRLNVFKELGESLKKFASDASFNALWDMGEALYQGEDAAKAFGRSLLMSILQNIPAMLFQAGFKLALMPGGLLAGLGLMAASGLAGIAGGYLTAALNSDSSATDDEESKIQRITDQLKELIDEAKSEAEYYQSQLRKSNSSYSNSVISGQSVNDAIIAPGGKIITTAPDDYLYAAKDPSKFGGSGGNNVVISVVNEAGDTTEASASSMTNADGVEQISILVKKIVKSGFQSGDFDSAITAQKNRVAGRRVSQ